MKRIQIFAVGKKDIFDNVFTLIRSVDEIYQQEVWKQSSGSKSLKHTLLMTGLQSLLILLRQKENTVLILVRRQS